MSSDGACLLQAQSDLEEQQELPRRNSAIKKISFAFVAAATLALMFALASRSQSLMAVDPDGVVSKADGIGAITFSDYKDEFVENCVYAFKEGNKEIDFYPHHRFNEDNLDYLCKKYWIGYTKLWRPWATNRAMYPSPDKTGFYGDLCQDREAHTGSWFNHNFLFPDEEGNKWLKDCGKFLDLVAEVNDADPEDEIIPEEERKDCHGDAKAVKVKDGYCHSTRVGLGSEHGFGHKSLEDCASMAEEDQRCNEEGYFDAVKTGDEFQCKCPTGACVQFSNPQAAGWAIYQMETGPPESHCS